MKKYMKIISKSITKYMRNMKNNEIIYSKSKVKFAINRRTAVYCKFYFTLRVYYFIMDDRNLEDRINLMKNNVE